jgi:hypothetical protein
VDTPAKTDEHTSEFNMTSLVTSPDRIDQIVVAIFIKEVWITVAASTSN